MTGHDLLIAIMRRHGGIRKRPDGVFEVPSKRAKSGWRKLSQRDIDREARRATPPKERRRAGRSQGDG